MSRITLATLVVWGLHACASPTAAQGPVDAVVLAASSQCQADARLPRASWISDEVTWRHRFAAMGGDARLAGQERNAVEVPTVDFRGEAVVVIEMGQRSTAGYSLEPLTPLAWIEDDVLVVGVRWTEPPPEGMVAQVLTSPCIAVRVPKGAYQRIRIQDQGGHRLAVIDL